MSAVNAFAAFALPGKKKNSPLSLLGDDAGKSTFVTHGAMEIEGGTAPSRMSANDLRMIGCMLSLLGRRLP